MKMSRSFEDQKKSYDYIHTESVKITPSVLTPKLSYDDDFVPLQVYRHSSLNLSESYMEREIQKVKNQSMNIDTYIVNTKMHKSVQFYEYEFGPSKKTTYLTAPHFTLGLQQSDDWRDHVIANESPVTPLYVCVCSGEKTKYQGHANRSEALVNKRMLQDDFEVLDVQPKTKVILPKSCLYFVYAVSHSKYTFTREHRSGPNIHDDYVTFVSTAPNTAKSLAVAGPSVQRKDQSTCFEKKSKMFEVTLLKKKNKTLELENRRLKKKVYEQDRDLAILKYQKKKTNELERKIASLNSQVARLKAKFKYAKNVLK